MLNGKLTPDTCTDLFLNGVNTEREISIFWPFAPLKHLINKQERVISAIFSYIRRLETINLAQQLPD